METKSYTDTVKCPGMQIELCKMLLTSLYVCYRGLNKQYYEEFIVPNEEVDRHLDLTGYFGEVYSGIVYCSTGIQVST